MTVPQAARELGVSAEFLRNEIRRGHLHTTRSFYRYPNVLRVSFLELREYFRYLGYEPWHLRGSATAAYLGGSLKEAARRDNALWDQSLRRFLTFFMGFDGSFILGPDAIRCLQEEELEFACRDLFHYNQVVLRHRPFCSLRYIKLGYDRKTHEKSRELQEQMQVLYPGVVQRVPADHLLRMTCISWRDDNG